MKKLLLTVLTLTAIAAFVHAQTLVSSFRNAEGLWGYLNEKGEIVIEPRFDNAGPFGSNGLALVKDPATKEFYYIRLNGEKLQLDCNPEKLKDFHNGRAIVVIGEKTGFIDSHGKLVIPANYVHVTHFSEDRAFAKDDAGKVFLIDETGKNIDLGDMVITGYNEFSEGLARVKIGELWGFADRSGKMVIEAKFEKVGNFQGGLVWARMAKGSAGYINKSGEYVIEAQYDVVQDFDPMSEMARVKKAKAWFYIDKNNNKLTVAADHFFDFSEGLLRADKVSAPGVYGFVNTKGDWVIEPKYESAGDFHFGLCRVRENGKWGLIDKAGNYLIEPQYDRLEDFVKIMNL
jgi:hypothetical protein